MKGLLIVDIQYDFLPGGALGVKEGDQVVPVINQLTQLPFDVVVASQDWHPIGHGSFASTHQKTPGEVVSLKGLPQILWPDHCVQGSKGAEIVSSLDVTKLAAVIPKGTDPDIDSYSAFFDNGHKKATGLDPFLKEKGVKELYIAGLATDYCVKFSTLDALALGYDVFVVIDACRAVNLNPLDEQEAISEMQSRGARIVTLKEVKERLM
ncbi:bifunctional nicotinamidase/pyrazinamidase [Estrella lausannensis]|uniref:Nicotinamidase n=1 Tax=Estrella lausannensis TaxID=483423 RepID=A0A0H5DTY9_9BACT|nr:bifunctional nicotinamidase/pyrazinamidase [Estrella lausannensis]CRX39359.1 Pyrazinamidase/nicotinamidase [Estrella lausannensis]